MVISILEVPGRKCLGRKSNTVGGEHSREEPFEQLVNNNSENLHISARPVENAHRSNVRNPEPQFVNKTQLSR